MSDSSAFNQPEVYADVDVSTLTTYQAHEFIHELRFALTYHPETEGVWTDADRKKYEDKIAEIKAAFPDG